MINGYSTYRETVSFTELHTQTSTLVSKLNYSGFLGLDFIFSNNVFYMVDYNPRITNGICLLTNAISISTIPYLIKNFSPKSLIKSIVYSDIISFDDPMPFFYMILMFIRLILSAILNFSNPFAYVRTHIEKSIVKYD
jgi:predicted ATP-grasp superfamily ATP-dependent carboligase